MKHLFILLLLYVVNVFPIGYQHGIFESRSTQGVGWQGSSEIITEHYTITVMPSYLDVELDWEFNCDGWKEPDSFKNALEIVGNLNLAQDAAVTGMLLWNGDEILKAKLKPIQLAREQYEEVVDRNAPEPQRPRDPVIFEYGWGDDNYDISIFPVEWQGSRKLRMRYVIPAVNFNGKTAIPFPTAFNPRIATYKCITGTGVSSFAFIKQNGTSTGIEENEVTFKTGTALYNNTILVHPRLPISDTENKSVFYTASISQDDIHGTLTHVIGRTGPEILEMVQLKEDILVLWRWNHPEYLHMYKRQLSRQADFLKEYFNQFTGEQKRAALVVDIPGKEKRTFQLGTKSSSTFTEMVVFLDSLAGLEYSDDSRSFNPEFSEQQMDSIVTASVAEFMESLQYAISLFNDSKTTSRRIILLTAGPRWINKNGMQFNQNIWGTDIATFTSLYNSGVLGTLTIPPEVSGYYWPGVNIDRALYYESQLSIEAQLTSGSGESISRPVSAKQIQNHYSWNFKSPHLDMKLFSTGNLRPEITWRVSRNGTVIAEIIEEPEIVQLDDPVSFGCALAGSGLLQSVDAELPSSLAATFGFVDRQYALLALEEDVMEPDDQERYRTAGVPPLTSDDIFTIPDEDTPPAAQETVDAFEATENKIVRTHTLREFTNRITIQNNRLRITLDKSSFSVDESVTVTIYSLSGKRLYVIRNQKFIDHTLLMSIPESLCRTQQACIVTVAIGKKHFSQTVVFR